MKLTRMLLTLGLLMPIAVVPEQGLALEGNSPTQELESETSLCSPVENVKQFSKETKCQAGAGDSGESASLAVSASTRSDPSGSGAVAAEDETTIGDLVEGLGFGDGIADFPGALD